MSSLSIELDIDDARLEGYIQDILEQSGKFRPVVIGDYCDHAFDVEFGTNGVKGYPYDPKSSYKARGGKSPVLIDLEKWVERKLHYTGKEKERVALKVYHNVMKDGIPPQPFFRVAVHNIINMIESDKDWFNKDGNDLLEAARLMKEEMIHILYENGTPFTGEIVDSIRYGYAEEGQEDISEAMARLPPGVLESDWADLNGNEERAREAKKRRSR